MKEKVSQEKADCVKVFESRRAEAWDKARMGAAIGNEAEVVDVSALRLCRSSAEQSPIG